MQRAPPATSILPGALPDFVIDRPFGPIEYSVYATIPGGGGGYTGSSNGDHGAFNSESGVGSGSLRDIDDADFDGSANDGEDEPLPPLGTAIALYAFEGKPSLRE